MTVNKYGSLLEFNKELDKVVQELSATWEGKKVEEKQHDPKLAFIRKIIETNHALLIGKTQDNTARIHSIKALKELSDLTSKINTQDEYFETEMKTIALCLKNLSKKKDDIKESIATIKTLQEVDENLYLQTLAEWINTRKVPIKRVKLSEEQMLKLAPYLTYLDITDGEQDWGGRVKNSTFSEEFIEKLLKSSPNLNFLSIENSRFTGAALAALNGHENLKQLTIRDCDAFNQPLPELKNLRQLTIERCRAFNQPLPELKNLRQLTIESRDFNQPLSRFKNLQRLIIRDCPAFNQPLSKLKNLQQLTILYCLDFNRPLYELKSLQQLTIQNCHAFNQLLYELKNLQRLTIQNCHAFNQPLYELKSLQQLTIQNCHAFNQLLYELKNLQWLRIECYRLTIPPDLSACKELIGLNLCNCRNLTMPPDLSECPAISYLIFTGCEKIKNFIRNILKANIEQQVIKEDDISNLQTHIAKHFPFLNDIFEEAKGQKDLLTRKALIAWLAYTVGVLNSLEEKKVTAIKNTGLLRDIYNYRVPRMRDSLVHVLSSLSLEKINMVNETFKGKKKWTKLPTIFLVEMLEKGMPKKHFDALVKKIDREKEFKNANSLTALISFLKNLSIAKEISREDSMKLLDIALEQESGKDVIKILQIMDAILELFGSKRLKKEVLETENPDLGEFFTNAFKKIFSISDIDDFSDRYGKEIVSKGDVTSLFTYLKSVNKLTQNEKERVFPLLTKFVDSVLRGTFLGIRYDTENNLHLQTVFNYFSEMEKESKGIDYIALWKKAPEPKSIVETEEPKEVEPFDFMDFFNKTILTDKHLEPDDFPGLRDFLNATRGSRIILQELRDDLKDMRNRKETESSIAKVQFQMKAIELCNPKKQIKQIEALLSELEEIVGKLPKSEAFQNDLETATSMLKPPAVEPTEYKVSETDEAWDLFLIGTIIKGSCQRIDGDPTRNKCLLAYVMDGKNKAIVVKDRRGRIVARTMLRLLWDEKKGKPVLFQERLYSNVNDSKIEKAIDQWAVNRAKQLGLTLVSKERGAGEPYDGEVTSLGGPAPFEYSDAGGGVTNGIYRIENCHIRYSPPASS